MALIMMAGFEMGSLVAENDQLGTTGGPIRQIAGTLPSFASIAQDIVRSGLYALKLGPSGSTFPGSACQALTLSTNSATAVWIAEGVTAYYSGWFYWSGSAPASDVMLFRPTPSGHVSNDQYTFCVRINGSTGMLEYNGDLPNANGIPTTWISTGVALPIGTWFNLAASVVQSVGGGNISRELRINGVSIFTDTMLPWSASTNGGDGYDFQVFAPPAASGASLYVDDIIVCDSTGTAQNTWPALDAKLVCLKPVADSARGSNWLGGAGGTTSLFDAVDNKPPAGATTPTNTSQIKNAAKDTTGLYTTSVEAYNVALASGGGGIAAADTIDAVQALGIWYCGSNSTAMTLGIAGAANPALTEKVGAIASTDQSSLVGFTDSVTAWYQRRTAPAYSPTVTLGTRPTVSVRKGTSSTTALWVCEMGLYVLYRPAAVVALPAEPVRTVLQAVGRAALWMKRHVRSGLRLWTPADPVSA